MGKKKDKKKADIQSSLPFEQYNVYFQILKNGSAKVLRDKKSEQNAYIPIKITDDEVYVSEPDGEMIPQIEDQRKCDYLLYCLKQLQVCYIELKGKNISTKDKYNPYDQIIDTRKYLKTLSQYKSLFTQDTESHAFIVSPMQQKIPKGIELKERALLQELIKYQKKRPDKMSYIHYVKVTPSSEYSDKGQKIICSSVCPIPMPYKSP